MKSRRVMYYSISLSLTFFSLVYCTLVFYAGKSAQYGPQEDFGYDFLIGNPNYYIFYLMFLPFVATGVMHLAFENRYIRFFGSLSDELDDLERKRVNRLRKILPVVCLLSSLWLVVEDTKNKGSTLPPYAFPLISAEWEKSYTRNAQNGEENCLTYPSPPCEPKRYFKLLGDMLEYSIDDVTNKDVTEFLSYSASWSKSSWLYRFEAILNLLAASIVSIFVAEGFLLMFTRRHIKAANRNLIVWMLVLASFWFPTRWISIYHFSLNPTSKSQSLETSLPYLPGIFLFLLFVFALGVLVVLFIRLVPKDLSKYASSAAAVVSFSMALVSVYRPNYWNSVFDKLQFGYLPYFVVSGALLFLFLFIVTDYFLVNCEQEMQDAV